MVGTTTQNLTITQKLAIYWLKNIDSQLLLFKQLKSLNQWLRYVLSAGLILFTYFFLQFAISLIGDYFSTAPMADVWYFVGNIFYYGLLIGVVLILTLESVYDIDVASELKNLKAHKQFVKQNKLQFWRLRNMHFFFRVLLYFSFYMFCLSAIKDAAEVMFMITFEMAKNTPETHQQIALFMREYESSIRWFTFLYFIGILVLDYFVHKKRLIARFKKAETEEVPHENIA